MVMLTEQIVGQEDERQRRGDADSLEKKKKKQLGGVEFTKLTNWNELKWYG